MKEIHYLLSLAFAWVILAFPATQIEAASHPKSLSFDAFFCDSTLRIDYALIGNAEGAQIALDRLSRSPRWHGRRAHLDSLLMAGNGQLTVRDHASQRIIYRTQFSTLFQEWLAQTDEPQTQTRSFENVQLIPMPRQSIDVEMTLFDMRRRPIAQLKHLIDPADILIRRMGETSLHPFRIIHPCCKQKNDETNSLCCRTSEANKDSVCHQDGQSRQECAKNGDGRSEQQCTKMRDRKCEQECIKKQDGKSKPQSLYNGDSEHDRDKERNRIEIVFLAEGYTVEEMETFYRDAQIAVEAFMEHEPFSTLRDRLRFIAVGAPSAESGVSIPKQGIWKQTVCSSHFSTFYSDRYLTSLRLKDIHDALAGIPYEHIIILANTDNYGGGGILNMYNLCSTHHALFRPVVVHEFGHSFAGLADEYFYDNDVASDSYPTDIEPWEFNITTKTDKEKAIRIGHVEGGAYSKHGIWRYQEDCRMRTNTYLEFCPACQEAIEKVIRFYTE